MYHLALHLNVCFCRVCKNAADVAAGLVLCCWSAAFACRDMCLHAVGLGHYEVVLYRAFMQGSTSAVHASLVELLLLIHPQHKVELNIF